MESAKVVVTERGRGRRATRKPRKPRKVEDHPAFGIWADRQDMKDVHAWLRKIRTPRYLREGGTLFLPPRQEPGRKRKS
jgi:hypothetical protein